MMDSEILRRFFVPVFFALLALVFALLGWRDRDSQPGAASPARKTRFRVAAIFALVAVLLLILQGCEDSF
jgi:hypothetical protein